MGSAEGNKPHILRLAPSEPQDYDSSLHAHGSETVLTLATCYNDTAILFSGTRGRKTRPWATMTMALLSLMVAQAWGNDVESNP